MPEVPWTVFYDFQVHGEPITNSGERSQVKWPQRGTRGDALSGAQGNVPEKRKITDMEIKGVADRSVLDSSKEDTREGRDIAPYTKTYRLNIRMRRLKTKSCRLRMKTYS
jgi:hypothetical protein